ncbi:MAG: laccase domain-containing protein [Deltaproteobacteria bacterium]|nr:laccase domain-containing protein [Deltaproteobacteria bacterium]
MERIALDQLAWYESTLLRMDGVVHGFGTKGTSIEAVAAALGFSHERIARLHQVHGATVHSLKTVPTGLLTGDALLTVVPDLVLQVKTADCLPILLQGLAPLSSGALPQRARLRLRRFGCHALGASDLHWRSAPPRAPRNHARSDWQSLRRRRIRLWRKFLARHHFPQRRTRGCLEECAEWSLLVGAIHAGWRGLAAGVITAALREARGQYGVAPGSIRCAIGPSMGPNCYEVGHEVIEALTEAGHDPKLIARKGERDRWWLNLASCARAELIRGGVAPDRIDVSPNCTHCSAEEFHSYRRTRERSGRQYSFIALRASVD